MDTKSDLNDKKILYQKMMGSNFPEVRQKGWDGLYRLIRPKLYRSILAETGSIQDTEDILHETYERLYQKFGEGKKYANYVEAVAFTTAHRLNIDKFRKQSRIIASLDDETLPQIKEAKIAPSPAEILSQEWVRKDVLDLILHIPNERDRLLALLLYNLGLSPQMVHLYTGWHAGRIYKRHQIILKNMRFLHKNKDDYLDKPSPWFKDLSFTGQNTPLCVSFLNVSPREFSHETLQSLLKDLDQKNLQQVWRRYIAMLRYENIGTLDPALFLTFMPRKYFNEEVIFHGASINYATYLLGFDTETYKGIKKKKVLLQNGITFYGRLTQHIHDTNGRIVGIDYEFPAIGIKARKVFTEKIKGFIDHPMTKEEAFYIYQISPI